MECSTCTIAGYDFDWRHVGRRLLNDLKVRDIDREGGSEEEKREKMWLDLKRTKLHIETCIYQELLKVGRDREKNEERQHKSQGLLQGQHLNISTKLLQSENFRSLQEEGGISWPEGLHYLYSKYDADIKKEDRSDCNFLGYNIANSRQKWKFELQNCFINKDCVQMLKAAENGGAFDSMKSMDLSNNHQLGNQGATLLGNQLCFAISKGRVEGSYQETFASTLAITSRGDLRLLIEECTPAISSHLENDITSSEISSIVIGFYPIAPTACIHNLHQLTEILMGRNDTPLNVAADADSLCTLMYLIEERKCRLECPGQLGTSLLHNACEMNDNLAMMKHQVDVPLKPEQDIHLAVVLEESTNIMLSATSICETTCCRMTEALERPEYIYNQPSTNSMKCLQDESQEKTKETNKRRMKRATQTKKCRGVNMQLTWSKSTNIYFLTIFLLVTVTCATGSVILSPQGNYTVFQSTNPVSFNCSGDGTIALWTLNGNSTNNYEVTITPYDPKQGAVVPSHLSIIPYSTYNNTQVVCSTITIPTLNTFRSSPTLLIIQGPLDAPSNFFVNISNTSNTTFLLSWGAPFSLDVTDSPDIFYYTLCTNITIYGCRTIPSDPDCTFPRTCTSSVDFTDPSLNGTNGGQNKTIMDYGDPIHFTFFAVNGAGNGTKANFTYKNESVPNASLNWTEATKSIDNPTTSSARAGTETEISPIIGGIIAGVVLMAAVCIAVLFVCRAYIRGRRRNATRTEHIELNDNDYTLPKTEDPYFLPRSNFLPSNSQFLESEIQQRSHQNQNKEFCATPDMSMALPSGYENVVRHVTSDHHADQNFEPDLATHEATSDPERLDIKKGIKTIGMDEHSADDKNIQMHKPSKEESNLAELDNEVHVDAENISTDKHSADENTRTSVHKPSMNEVQPQESWCQEPASVTGGFSLVVEECPNLSKYRYCSQIDDDNDLNMYCTHNFACPIPFNKNADFANQIQITNSCVMNSRDIPMGDAKERLVHVLLVPNAMPRFLRIEDNVLAEVKDDGVPATLHSSAEVLALLGNDEKSDVFQALAAVMLIIHSNIIHQ